MYSLRSILHYIYIIVPVFLVGVLLVSIFRKQSPSGEKERIRRWVKRLPLILVVTILGGGIAMAYQVTGVNLQNSCKIGFNYPTASKGLAPNQTKLDVEEILSDEVLDAAIEKGDLTGIESYELREALDVYNALQKDSVSTENYYLSTEYILEYSATPLTQKYDSQAVLQAVYDAYYDYFVEKYGRKVYMISDDFSELAELDYLDTSAYLGRRINNIIDYMNLCRTENSSFVSDVTGESFNSIATKATNFRNVSLERYEAYVLRNGLSKDKEQYISRLNYDNQMLNVRYMKNLAAYGIRLSAIDMYAGDITTAVLVPSRDRDGEFYQSRTKIGTDYFAYDSNEYLNSATDRQLEISQNNYRIEMLEAGKGGAAEAERAETMISELKSEIIELGRLAVETVQDYDEQIMNDYMSVSYTQSSGVLADVVKYAAVLFVIASLTAFISDDMKFEKKKRKQL